MDSDIPEPTAGLNAETSFVRKKLMELRRRLLDLTARNSLLNYRHPKGTSVRVADEVPNEVVASFTSGRGFTFAPVPKPSTAELKKAGFTTVDTKTRTESVQSPTAEVWAKHLGISTSYELPRLAQSMEHRDDQLQTLMFPESLESRLRSIRSKSKGAINEMGCNVLFAVVGFLEWYESDDSQQKRLAPLYTVAVDIDKDKLNARDGAFRYRIEPRDEDVLSNVTLREKLKEDFGLALPGVGDGQTPEEYFEEVENGICRENPRWSVQRGVTLAILNFQKQAMYEDLDPARWPDESLLDHEVIQAFFSSAEDLGDDREHREEYQIDSIPNCSDAYPVVFDADSSQHSAIIDALDGKNLVIEGPPGTGKSQTITNLIAACLASGKTVLFVAEKMAALEVVKKRLDKIGLGQFCLELHGHRSRKGLVLEGLAKRIAARFRPPKQIAKSKALHTKYQKELNDHAQRVNQPWRNTEMTCHEILAGAVRYKAEIDCDSIPRILLPEGAQFDPVVQQEIVDNSRRLVRLHAAVSKHIPGGKLEDHFWYGVRKTELIQEGEAEFLSCARRWVDSLSPVLQAASRLSREFDLEADGLGLERLDQFWETVARLPELDGVERLAAVEPLSASLSEVRECLELRDLILKGWAPVLGVLVETVVRSPKGVDEATRALENLYALDVPKTVSLGDLAGSCKRIRDLEGLVDRVSETFNEIKSHVPQELYPCFEPSVRGLKEFQTLCTLLNALPAELRSRRDPMFDRVELDSVLEELKEKIRPLVSLRETLKNTFDLTKLPCREDLARDRTIIRSGGIFKWFTREWRRSRRNIRDLSIGTPAALARCLGQTSLLDEYISGLEAAVRVDADSGALRDQFDGVDTPIDQLSAMRDWYRQVREEYGSGFASRSGVAEVLFNLEPKKIEAILSYQQGPLGADTSRVVDRIEEVREEYPAYKPLADPGQVLSGSDRVLGALVEAVERELSVLCSSFLQDSIELEASKNAVEHARARQRDSQEWERLAGTKMILSLGFELDCLPPQEADLVSREFRETLRFTEIAVRSPSLIRVINENPERSSIRALAQIEAADRTALEVERDLRREFVERGSVDLGAWRVRCGDSVERLIERTEAACKKPEWLSDWLSYLRVKAQLIPAGLEAFVALLEEVGLTEDEIEAVARASMYQQMTEEILAESPKLNQFYGPDHDSIRDQFQAHDRKLLQLKSEEIAANAARRDVPRGKAGGRVAGLTELALVKHEIGKKTRHIPLRDLLKRSANAVRGLKPCYMMSPMSVATHLQPGLALFDIVVMDEASQIKPQDALGAVARGRSLVVVGDPKQLPPTSFFDRVADEEDISEDEEVALESSESILDAVLGIFPTRRLRWHYRSRHESLIQFSAEQFYDGGLVLFPSPFEINDEYGVKLHPVDDGFFVDQINRPEARAIADALITHLAERSHESVGVVAMSAKQRDFIEEEIEERQKADASVRELIERNAESDEPIFLKNLESVQGDERDVIIVSMTYGPIVPGGTPPQRFGPINFATGWRRLNVLLTRAKKRMHVYTSLRSAQVAEGGSPGREALRKFLAFCERTPESVATETHREPDSDFEVCVIRALERHGYSCVPQLGVAGYFLDIAVRHPEDPGRYLAGVECDGATYHSAKSARDRDRLRQDVLEGLGWKVHRIWSTDWFKNPEKQIQGLLNVLEAAQEG